MKNHRCYFDEMRYDEGRNKWVCAVCGIPYIPPQRFESHQADKEWMPWKTPVPKVYIWRFAEQWRPWEDYSALRT